MGGCDGCAAWGTCTFSGNIVYWTCSTFVYSEQGVAETPVEEVLSKDIGAHEAEGARSKSTLEERE